MKPERDPHMARRMPKPTAKPGSLLALIELARYLVKALPGNAAEQAQARDLCYAAAEAHADLLNEAKARDGLLSYVEHCDVPWRGLWQQIAPVIGVPVDPPRVNTPLSLDKKCRRSRAHDR